MGEVDTREAWLLRLVAELSGLFTEAGLTIPNPIRISCSWPSRSIRKRLGECWYSKAADDGVRNLFISPVLDSAVDVAEIVVHETVHACLPDGTGHKGPFKRAMKAVGLEGKATATYAGEALRGKLTGLCNKIGSYPHVKLKLADGNKTQGTRMLKLECPDCGYVVRTTAKWLDVGLPVCVCGTKFKIGKSE